jgi:hypothetical protein
MEKYGLCLRAGFWWECTDARKKSLEAGENDEINNLYYPLNIIMMEVREKHKKLQSWDVKVKDCLGPYTYI